MNGSTTIAGQTGDVQSGVFAGQFLEQQHALFKCVLHAIVMVTPVHLLYFLALFYMKAIKLYSDIASPIKGSLQLQWRIQVFT